MKVRYTLLLHNEIRLICILCVNSYVLASEFLGIFVACSVERGEKNIRRSLPAVLYHQGVQDVCSLTGLFSAGHLWLALRSSCEVAVRITE